MLADQFTDCLLSSPLLVAGRGEGRSSSGDGNDSDKGHDGPVALAGGRTRPGAPDYGGALREALLR